MSGLTSTWKCSYFCKMQLQNNVCLSVRLFQTWLKIKPLKKYMYFLFLVSLKRHARNIAPRAHKRGHADSLPPRGAVIGQR